MSRSQLKFPVITISQFSLSFFEKTFKLREKFAIGILGGDTTRHVVTERHPSAKRDHPIAINVYMFVIEIWKVDCKTVDDEKVGITMINTGAGIFGRENQIISIKPIQVAKIKVRPWRVLYIKFKPLLGDMFSIRTLLYKHLFNYG